MDEHNLKIKRKKKIVWSLIPIQTWENATVIRILHNNSFHFQVCIFIWIKSPTGFHIWEQASTCGNRLPQGLIHTQWHWNWRSIKDALHTSPASSWTRADSVLTITIGCLAAWHRLVARSDLEIQFDLHATVTCEMAGGGSWRSYIASPALVCFTNKPHLWHTQIRFRLKHHFSALVLLHIQHLPNQSKGTSLLFFGRSQGQRGEMRYYTSIQGC